MTDDQKQQLQSDLEKLASAGRLESRHIPALLNLARGGCCHHRSWGFGRITTVDTVFARFTIDFPGKAGHQMDLNFAAESLRPLSQEHILARKATDLDGLRKLAATDHVELLRIVLRSFNGRASADQIMAMLVPDVIKSDWKKWWEGAKHDLKKDGHFQVPSKKNEPVVFQQQEVTLQQRLLEEFRAAKGLKAHLTVAGEVLKNVADLEDRAAAGTEVITSLNTEIGSHQRTQPAVALEAIFVRDDLAQAAGLPPVEGEVTAAQIWTQENVFRDILENIPATRHRRALESFKNAAPGTWTDIVLIHLNSVSAKLCKEFASLLVQENKLELLRDALARLVSQHGASSELLLWLAKERSDVYADIIGPEVFRAMLTAMERDQFNEKRSSRLRDYILADQDLLPELIDSADLEVVKDVTRALQLSPVFDDERDRRSLLARIIKIYPAMQSLISGEQTKQDTSLVVSWGSLERRKSEYEELVHKKIPANSKEIAIARSYGDLRENHEYKAAKEMQKLLMRGKHDLETQISRARGTDFAGARTDVVGPGTIVRLTDLETSQPETYTILGAWDGDPDKGILSYLTPLAQALLGKAPGQEVDFELEKHQRRFRVEGIEAYNPAAGTAVGAAPAAETVAPATSTTEAQPAPAAEPDAAATPATSEAATGPSPTA
jgi:transcription elongation GreA/GreB family factor